MIRAKFRCLSITTKYDGMIIANLAPVKREGKDSENSQFWKYTPNGECELLFFKECPIVVGSYYYIDMTRVDDATDKTLWGLHRRDENHGYVNIEIGWHLKREDYSVPPPVGMTNGKLKVGLSEDAEVAQDQLKPTRSLWKMDFIFAESSDS